MQFQCQNSTRSKRTKIIYDYKNVDLEGLINHIKNFNFDSNVFCHPKLYQLKHYTEVLQDAFAIFVPTKTAIIHPKDEPWANSFTRLLLRNKNRNYHIFKKANAKYINENNKNDPNPEIVSNLK